MMKTLFSVLAIALAATAAAGEDIYDNGNHKAYTPPPVEAPAKSLCETDTGYGLVYYTANQALFNRAKANLAAGRTVVTGQGYTLIGAVEKWDGSLVLCYRTW